MTSSLSLLFGLILATLYVCGTSAQEQRIMMYVTSYGFNDNTPASAAIAYPKNDGNPTIHNKATETQGTYSNPITFATDKKALPVGTIVYLPYLRKYFIMEDDCVACDGDWKKGKRHIDLYMGPQVSSSTNALDSCEASITKSSTMVIVNPSPNYQVETTPLFSNNKCSAVMFGSEIITIGGGAPAQPTQPPVTKPTQAPATQAPTKAPVLNGRLTGPCSSEGVMRCATSETYQTCDHNLWSAIQSCQQGLNCSPSGSAVYCL